MGLQWVGALSMIFSIFACLGAGSLDKGSANSTMTVGMIMFWGGLIVIYVGKKAAGKTKLFEVNAQRYLQIIQESIEIINKSKNPETISSRCDILVDNFKKLFDAAPPNYKFNIDFDGQFLNKITDLGVVEKFKTTRLAHHFKNQIESELRKAEMLSDAKMQISQYKKALNEALSSVDYLPENSEIKRIVLGIEEKIKLLQSSKPHSADAEVVVTPKQISTQA